MLEIAHFSVGAGLTCLLLTVTPLSVRYPRTTMALGGLWGMLPDVHWVVPFRPLADAVHAVHNSAFANLFWFHHLLDHIDPGDSKVGAAAVFGGFVASVAFAEWNRYRTPPDLDRLYDRLFDALR